MVKRDSDETRTDPVDGLPGTVVGNWSLDKHEVLQRYVDITSAARAKFLGRGKAGATFIDLFCSYGRSCLRENGTWIDGSALLAWRTSVDSGTPFSAVYIADKNASARHTCALRLKALNALPQEVEGDAVSAAAALLNRLDPYALHTVFLDPYTLGTLDFEIIRALSKLRRVDLLVHVSKMDLQRNLGANLSTDRTEFDKFAPGWRNAVRPGGDPSRTRADVLDYWRSLIEQFGVWPAPEMKLITGSKSQHLYWLSLASKNPLALKFWKIASNPSKQGDLFN